MTRHIHAQPAQLLDQSPYFRAVGRDLLRNFRPADYDGRVLYQQADDAAKTDVCELLVWRNGPRQRTPAGPSCPCLLNAGIMLERDGNYKSSICGQYFRVLIHSRVC